MSINGGFYVPTTQERTRDECQRCPRCHPGKTYSTAFCRVNECRCHRNAS